MIMLAAYLVAGYILIWAAVAGLHCLGALFEWASTPPPTRVVRPPSAPLPPVPFGTPESQNRGPGTFIHDYRDDRGSSW
jgi:hypothetical protein